MVPFLRRLTPGETPTASDYNKLVETVESLRRPIGAGGGLNAFLSVMGPQIRDYGLEPHYAQIGQQGYTPVTGSAVPLDNYAHKQYFIEIDGTGNAFESPNGIEGFVDVDSSDTDNSFYPAVEIAGRIDVPDSYIGQLTPHPSGQYFQFQYTPQTIVRACLEGNAVVAKDDMTPGTNSYYYQLAETYTQLPGQEGRAILALGFASAWMQLEDNQNVPDDTYIAVHIGIVSDEYDAENPTDASPEAAYNSYDVTSLMFAFQARDGSTNTILNKGTALPVYDDFDTPTGWYVPIQANITSPRDNQIGTLSGSAVCRHLVEYPQSSYGMNYRGRYPDNIYTRLSLWLYVYTNYTGDFTIAMAGGSAQWPLTAAIIGGNEVGVTRPALIAMQVSTDDPMLLCDAPSFSVSSSLDSAENSQFLISDNPL